MPRWTPEARILFWAGPEAPDFPARPGDPVALSRLTAGDVADAAAARQQLTAWAEGAGVAFYSRVLDRVEVGDRTLTVARVISPQLRALPRVEPREGGVMPHPFF